MEQLLPSTAVQLLQDGYTVLWLPSSNPLAKSIRDAHYASGALFSAVANSAPARAALQSVSSSESNFDYAAGLCYYSKESPQASMHDGRINCTFRGTLPAQVISSSHPALVFNDLRDRLVSLQSSLLLNVASLMREAGSSVFSKEPAQHDRGVKSFLESLVLSDEVPAAAAAGGPVQQIRGTASSITAQYYQPHNAIDSHIDCTLVTVACPSSAEDERLQMLHQGAWVSPLRTNPGTGQPVVIWAGHLLDVALGSTGAAARACHHRVQASSDPQATTTARVSIVLRVKPHEEASLNPLWAVRSLPESAAKRCKDVVAAFRAQYVSVNHPAYVPESATGGAAAGISAAGAAAGAGQAGGSPGEQQAGVKRARTEDTGAEVSSFIELPPPPPAITITIRESDGTLSHFKVKPTTKFQKIFNAFYKKKGADPGSYRFTYGGPQMDGEKTPGELELEDGALIDAAVQQSGD